MGSISSTSYWIVALSSVAVGALWAWVIGPLLFQRDRDQPPLIIPSLILPIAVVLLFQMALAWSLATPVGQAGPTVIATGDGVTATSPAEHERILAAIDELHDLPAALPQPVTEQGITPLGWIVLLSLPFVAALAALLFARLFDRFFGKWVGKKVAAVTGGLFSIPFTLLGTFNLYEKLDLDFFNDFALFKIEQRSEIDTKAIADAVIEGIRKELTDGITKTVSADIATIVRTNISEEFKQQIIVSVEKELTKNLTLITQKSITHFENETTINLPDILKAATFDQREIWFDVVSNEGVVDCGRRDDLVIGTFEIKKADKLDDGQDNIDQQLDRVVERIRESRPNRYLSALILVGSADRLRLTPPLTNDDLARMRAEWVQQKLDQKLRDETDAIAPPKMIVINQMASRIRVSKEDGRELVRAVQVCALWVTAQRIMQQTQVQ